MLEAVNSVIQASPIVRSSAEQVSTADSYAANPQRVQKIAQAPYISPYIAVDEANNAVVLQIRDAQTGDVLATYPTRTSLEAKQQEEHRANRETSRATFADVRQQQASPSSSSKAAVATSQQLAAFAHAAEAANAPSSNVSVVA